MGLGAGSRKGMRVGLVALCWAVLGVASAWLALLVSINTPTAPVSARQARASFHRSVQWLRAHEAAVLADGNAALWWMIQSAASNSRDAYLNKLVERHLALTYAGNRSRLAWKRLVVPGANIDPDQPVPAGLVDYQRLFFHAATCRPGVSADPEARRMLSEHVCRPSLTRVWLNDRVCTTHQLLGVMLYRRQGCEGAAELGEFKRALLDDIETQAALDVFMHDGQIQRVLSLVWAGESGRVRSGWVHRILAQQRPDGGWAGHSVIPEFPDWLQVPAFKQAWRAVRGQPPLPPPSSDFHATAQGLLLMSLLAPAQQLLTADGSPIQ